ncbi:MULTISPECIES: sugar 3,4-ketoisomerase [Clostridium]|jgi:WxcM-like, C-terminal.|uniref:WxcM-like domain-containing protein n=3 Tax=Clostridium TaxID=1485 RepID=A0A1S8P2L1_CLOBE|nr:MULTISPECIES: FdtA/QdtA family cupin domain-containing protein [Clostridium]ABR34752.1 WxcM domain protein, C-terminal domain protein [Clostridium beijerinckii NCIMB 8052]AIU04021.1 WxcM domain-containing protein [Clostridium beijerinckii ATCC 35702]ALB46161.1 WxcM-like domain-containing protein [Clostridium beijerinckii NRRL B-598]AVK46729.1 dTDP-6-deoxy-3,4-keto-hexulose isomerase [Clostridium sp. MF28]MBC2458717.1 WxcM-like domain-containing protein [Clostridium beijerinckii]
MYNCSMFKFLSINSNYGNLTPIEEVFDVPFDIKRIYYITNVPQGVSRGFHAHRRLHQVLICINGSVKIKLKNPKEESEVILNDSSDGLYIGPYVWREMYDFSEDAILLVLASDYYNENDYIRNIDFYMNEAATRY